MTLLVMCELHQAWQERRLKASSSRCLCKPPDVVMREPNVLEITTAGGGLRCSLKANRVMLEVDGQACKPVVTGGPCGDEAVWIKLACAEGFWLEIQASQPSKRQIQARGDFYKGGW